MRRRAKALGARHGTAAPDERLALLYDIEKMLMRAEDPEALIPEVLSIAAATLSLHSAISAVRARGTTRMTAWPTKGTDVGVALDHAVATFAYLLREPSLSASGVEIRRGALSTPGETTHDATQAASDRPPHQFLALPLAVARRPIFGALQLESTRPLSASDLSFVDALVTELAAALDRYLSVQHRLAESDLTRGVAEAGAASARQGAVLAAARETGTREDRDFIQSVTQSLAEGVIAVGLDGKIVLANPAAEALLGWKQHEALGRDIAELVSVRDAFGHPIAPEEGPAARALRAGAEVRHEQQMFMDRSGLAVPVSYAASPIIKKGAVTGVVIAFTSASALRIAEREQRMLAAVGAALSGSLDQAEMLDAACTSLVPRFADIAFADVVLEGEQAVRSSVILGDGVETPLGRRIRAEAPSRGGATPQARVLDTGKAMLVADPEALLAGARSEERALWREVGVTSMLVLPFVVRHHGIVGALTCGMTGSGRRYQLADLAFAQEIADRAALALENAHLYETARQAVRAREEVLAIVSHDLRNPLSAIAMAAKLLLKQVDDGDREARRKMTAMIVRAAERMAAQVERLLDFSRLESGRLPLELHDCDLAAMLTEAVATIEPLAHDKGISVRVEVDPSAPHVVCDADRIQQVIGNLLGNALKFTPRGGTIVLRAERVGRDTRLSVADSGPGIPVSDRTRIFDAFWQAKPGGRSGAGLGLSIARGIVDAHGGKIWVEGEPGEGSTFVVLLPGDAVS